MIDQFPQASRIGYRMANAGCRQCPCCFMSWHTGFLHAPIPKTPIRLEFSQRLHQDSSDTTERSEPARNRSYPMDFGRPRQWIHGLSLGGKSSEGCSDDQWGTWWRRSDGTSRPRCQFSPAPRAHPVTRGWSWSRAGSPPPRAASRCRCSRPFFHHLTIAG